MSHLGKVYLVGAGPGDPGLLSLRGQQCLQRADIVYYDGLANPLLLKHTTGRCERTSRQMSDEGKQVPQDEINLRLIQSAREGKTVVRLKGGDPFVFGRGSEEATALREAGIEYEIVPGITAAVAAAEYAGISVTHRNYASAVAFITGHEDPTKPDSFLDYENLAQFSGTLVFYMGLRRISQITTSLINHGLSPETPACIISHGTLGSQRTVSGTVETLAAQAKDQKISAPSLIMIGHCVTLRDELKWFENRPLFGQSIAITRPLDQAYETADLAIEYGATPVLLPTIEIQPPDFWVEVDEAIEQIEHQDWLIFTSRNGVTHFLNRFFELGYDLRRLGHVKFAVIGTATAEALRQFHLNADLMPETYRAEELAAALSDSIQGQNVLWCGADRGREVLQNELAPLSAEFRKLTVYRNVDVLDWSQEAIAQLTSGAIDWLPLSSPSIARGAARLLPDSAKPLLGNKTKIVAISPVTAQAAEEAGLPVNLVADTHTWPGIFDAIVNDGSR
ncbi:MAG: uroporphyrinogen-III C-methyltransferase [Planctomycetaceae bacterium]|jgi:uroporphyrinogen III methyltransferase / synthase|nr:uroporphyrinogen-III C-methyltransferase [Planctomycetaceae bacterium]